MTLTKKTVITWATPMDARFQDILNKRLETLNAMVQAGKTDGFYTAISDREFERHWIDQTSAQEYIDAMYEAASPHGNIIVSAVISDI